jgi:ubiquinone/menaquinone biosynthesis C-methylase UbiE
MAYSEATLAPETDANGNQHPWDAAAVGWNRHADLIHAWLHDATQAMMEDAHIRPGSRVLDIAAGAGDQTLDIARRIGSTGWVLATDVSPGILALAQKNAQAANLKQVSTQVADAQSLGLAGADFDAAVCRLGLMFCRSPLAAMSEIRAALRPQGRFTALVFGPPEGNPCVTIALETARKHAGLAPVSAAKPHSAFEPGSLMSLGKPGLLAQLLNDAGFAQWSVRSVSAPFRAQSAAHYVNFLHSSASPIIEILAPLSAASKQAAWSDMTEQLAVFSTPSGWTGPNELLQCVATAPCSTGDDLTSPVAKQL